MSINNFFNRNLYNPLTRRNFENFCVMFFDSSVKISAKVQTTCRYKLEPVYQAKFQRGNL